MTQPLLERFNGWARDIKFEVMDEILNTAESTELSPDENISTVAKNIITKAFPTIQSRLIDLGKNRSQVSVDEIERYDQLTEMYLPGVKMEMLSIRRGGFLSTVKQTLEEATNALSGDESDQ